MSQKGYWSKLPPKKGEGGISSKSGAQYYQLDQKALKTILDSSSKSIETDSIEIEIPMLSENMGTFVLDENPVFHPDLAKKFPNIKSFVGWSEDGLRKINLSYSHRGIDGIMVTDLKTSERTIAEKKQGEIGVYKFYKVKNADKTEFKCEVKNSHEGFNKEPKTKQKAQKLLEDRKLRTYRIAISSNSAYTKYHGGKVADALAAMNATLTRINAILGVDVGVRLQLVANNDKVIFTNSDPYKGVYLDEVADVLINKLGADGFDLGHLLLGDLNLGGVAYLNGLCWHPDLKSGAFSSSLRPEGYGFDMLVAHEVGHQLGATHTWSYSESGSDTKVEPGSGSTIMGYAGVAGRNNVQFGDDDNYHYISIMQMTNLILHRNCGQTRNLSNSAPRIDPIPDYTIPKGTAFVLGANVTDTDSQDKLTYSWEQIDNGIVTYMSFGPENKIGANFRALPPSENPERYFPRLSRVLAGELTETNPSRKTEWETVSNVKREMNFALTVRDNGKGGGQVAFELVKIDVEDTAGPFVVNSQSSNTSYNAGETIDIRWKVAKTNRNPVNAQTVDILLSVDGGLNFEYTLANNVQNSGSAKVELPKDLTGTSNARIMIKPTNNVFFAVNASDFSILPSDGINDSDSVDDSNADNGTDETNDSDTGDNTVQLEDSIELTITECETKELSTELGTDLFNDFDGRATFSATTPLGVEARFNPPSTRNHNRNVVLKLSNLSALSIGSYDITIIAKDNSVRQEAKVILNVSPLTLETVVPISPRNGADNTKVAPTLSWQAQSAADAYDVEIATDASFATVVEAATVSTNTFTPINLELGKIYFWRVRSKNECKEGVFGPTFKFSTIEGLFCNDYSGKNLPLAISGESSGIYTTLVAIQENVPLYDLSVALKMDHESLGDLKVKLISPSGKEVILMSNTCAGDNVVDAVFSDSAKPFDCGDGTNAMNGTVVRPLDSFTAFRGEATQGAWILEINDTSNGSGGSLVEFSMEICSDSKISRPDRDGDGVFDDGPDRCPDTPEGQEVSADGCPVYRFSPENFDVQVQSLSCEVSDDGGILLFAGDQALEYTATLTMPTLASPIERNFTDTVSFTDLVSGNYQLCITGNDGTREYRAKCFEITIGKPEPLSVQTILTPSDATVDLMLNGGALYNIELNGELVAQTTADQYSLSLESGVNKLKVYTDYDCQGVFSEEYGIDFGTRIAPSPAKNSTNLILDNFSGTYDLSLLSYSGQLVRKWQAETKTGYIPIDLGNLSSGTYFVKVEGNGIDDILKVIKE